MGRPPQVQPQNRVPAYEGHVPNNQGYIPPQAHQNYQNPNPYNQPNQQVQIYTQQRGVQPQYINVRQPPQQGNQSKYSPK